MIGTLLFVHLLAVVMIFAGLGIELAALALLHRAKTLGEVRSAVAPLPIVGPLMASGVPILLVAGISLIYVAGYGWQPWLVVAFALTVLLAITGKSINGSRGEAIFAVVQHPGDGLIPPDLDSARKDPVWNYAIFVSACELIALVFIMSNKPSLVMSLVSVAVAAIVAFVPTSFVLRRSLGSPEAVAKTP